MNTISGGIFNRKKPDIEIVFNVDNPIILSNPREDENYHMFVCSNAGDILNYNDEGEVGVYLAVGGTPNCLAFNSFSDCTDIYVADISNASVNKHHIKANPEQDDNENQNDYFMPPKLYESVPLKGPSSVVYSKNNNCIIFSDCGLIGQTSLSQSNGSLFLFDLQLGILRPLLLNCLSGPIDICYNDNSETLYVAELFKNRVLRLVQNPIGTFHCSVFHQFNGRFGPSALTIDALDNIYVARYEFQSSNGNKKDGLISILNKEGILIGELIIKEYSEINGMFISKDKNKANYLYFTDKGFPGVMKIKLTMFSNEMEKLQ